MATTMKLIAKTTLSAATNVVTFSSIPATQTDLYIVFSARTSSAAIYDGTRLEFNGSSANFSGRYLGGSGSAANSSTFAIGYLGSITGANATSNTFGSTEVYIPNYASSSNKSYSSISTMETNATTSYMEAVAGLWANTAAITQVSIVRQNADFVSGSSFYLYGVTHADDNSPGTFGIQATGGDVTISGGYKYHVFKSSGTFTVSEPGWVEVLTVGGGGGGGYSIGGGGGAGGYLLSNRFVNAGQSIVLVGSGGTGKSTSGGTGDNGTDSQVIVTAFGGGGGGSDQTTASSNGGSGGGLGRQPSGTGTPGSGVAGQGNSGGLGEAGNQASGGGGATAAGAVASIGTGGTGSNAASVWHAATGTGVLVSSSYYVAGGGGGGIYTPTNPNRIGGSGGGGTGGWGTNPYTQATSGLANTGGGGGGGAYLGSGGNGGSGIVIIRYPVS